MTLPDDDWLLLSRLLDEALAVPSDERADWLAALEGDAAQLRPRLAALLAREGEADARGFLAAPPDFTLPGADDASAADELLHAVGEAVGPWRLTRLLGRGGMAEVWLAERIDGSLARNVALKLPLPAFATGRMAARFARERDLLGGLSHPHIARLYDAGTTDGGQPWLAMEAVEGRPLLDWCEERRADIAHRLALVLQICDAVQYAHGRLVIHRDIKPNNILVTAEGEIRLLDFGVAKLLPLEGRTEQTSGITRLTGRPMTLDYASPEQLRGEEPGIATDIYAIGVLLYRLLSGVSPYEGIGMRGAALEAAILEQEPKPPSGRTGNRSLRRKLAGDIDTIVLHALKKLPADRYPTVDALAGDLRRHLAGEPVSARADSRLYRTQRFIRQHRRSLAALTLVVASLAIGAGVAWRQAQLAKDEAVRALAMYDFLRGLLNRDDSTSPDLQNRDMTVKDLVIRAAERLPSALPDNPRARFRLMQDISPLLLSLGLRSESIRILHLALDDARRQFGTDSVQVWSVQLELAEYEHEGRGDFQGAYDLADGALRVFERNGVTDPVMLGHAASLAGFYGTRIHPANDPRDLALLEQAVALLRPANDHRNFSSALETLAIGRGGRGDTAGALAAAVEQLSVNQRVYGNDNWKTAASFEQVAVWLRVRLRPDEAEAMLREALSIHRRVWPADHFLFGRHSKYLADVLVGGARRAEALVALEAGYAILSLPKWAGNVVVRENIEEALADLHWRAGRLREAAQWCENISREWPRKMVTSRIKAGQVCARVAIADGRESVATELLAGVRGEVERTWPGDAKRSAPWKLIEAERLDAMGEPDAAAYLGVLRDANPDDLDTLCQAWLDLARAFPQHGLLRGPELPALLARVDHLPPYFEEAQARLHEALGRARLGAGATAVQELQRAVALRSRADDAERGIWLAAALSGLASVQAANGEQAAAADSRAHAERLIGAGLEAGPKPLGTAPMPWVRWARLP